MSKPAFTDDDVLRFVEAAKTKSEIAAEGWREKVVSLCAMPSGMMALTSAGRLFFRELDSRNFDGRNPVKYVWREVEGPPL